LTWPIWISCEAALVVKRRSAATSDHLSVDVAELTMSLSHMRVNRMLRTAQQVRELLRYELLARP
jgi:hypothetical protein